MPTGKDKPDIGKLINDAVQAAIGEERKRADKDRKRKEDPWGAFEDLIDERIDAARKRDIDSEGEDKIKREGRRRTSQAGEDDDDDEGGDAGLFELFVGGGKGR